MKCFHQLGDWEEEMDARTRTERNGGDRLPSAHPFPLPSLPFDERAFDLLAEEETVLQSIDRQNYKPQ